MNWAIVAASILAFVLGVAWDEMPHPLLGWALFAALVVLIWRVLSEGWKD